MSEMISGPITIYGTGGNRSARVAWTVNELGIEVVYRHQEGLIGSDEFRKLHPQGKIPALQIGDLVLFESSAICEHLCDVTPANDLLAPSDTRQRSLHNQWVSFSQSEIEAYLWHSFQLERQAFEGEVLGTALPMNQMVATAGLAVLEQHLAHQDFLLGDKFSLTDIIVGWTINWSRKSGLLDTCPALQQYLTRLFDRQNIALSW